MILNFMLLIILVSATYNKNLMIKSDELKIPDFNIKYNNIFATLPVFHISSKYYNGPREIYSTPQPKIIDGRMVIIPHTYLEYIWLVILIRFDAYCEYLGIHI